MEVRGDRPEVLLAVEGAVGRVAPVDRARPQLAEERRERRCRQLAGAQPFGDAGQSGLGPDRLEHPFGDVDADHLMALLEHLERLHPRAAADLEQDRRGREPLPQAGHRPVAEQAVHPVARDVVIGTPRRRCRTRPRASRSSGPRGRAASRRPSGPRARARVGRTIGRSARPHTWRGRGGARALSRARRSGASLVRRSALRRPAAGPAPLGGPGPASGRSALGRRGRSIPPPSRSRAGRGRSPGEVRGSPRWGGRARRLRRP